MTVAGIVWGRVEFCDGGRNCLGARWNCVTVDGIVLGQGGIL